MSDRIHVIKEGWIGIIQMDGELFVGVTDSQGDALHWSSETGKVVHVMHIVPGDSVLFDNAGVEQDPCVFMVENYPDFFTFAPVTLH